MLSPGRFSRAISSRSTRGWRRTRARLLVRGSLPNGLRKLLPGMFANVVVLAGEPKEVVTVPRTAITYSLYGDSLYTVKEAPPAAVAADKKADGAAKGEPKLVVERRFVRTGPAREDRVVVVEGVKAGEQVVTTGQLKLNPGAAIHVDNSQPLTRPEARPKQ